MHSAAMTISQNDSQLYILAMISLLEDPLYLKTMVEAQDAVKQIKEVMSTFFIAELKGSQGERTT